MDVPSCPETLSRSTCPQDRRPRGVRRSSPARLDEGDHPCTVRRIAPRENVPQTAGRRVDLVDRSVRKLMNGSFDSGVNTSTFLSVFEQLIVASTGMPTCLPSVKSEPFLTHLL